MYHRFSQTSQQIPDAAIDPALLQSSGSWAPEHPSFPTIQQLDEDVQNSLVNSRRTVDRLEGTGCYQSLPSDGPCDASHTVSQESHPQTPRKRKRRSHEILQIPRSSPRLQERPSPHPVPTRRAPDWQYGNPYALLSMDHEDDPPGQNDDETIDTPGPSLSNHEIYPAPSYFGGNSQRTWDYPPLGSSMGRRFGEAGDRGQSGSSIPSIPTHVHGWPSTEPQSQDMDLWNTGAFTLDNSVGTRLTPVSPTRTRSHAGALSATMTATTYYCSSEGCNKKFNILSALSHHERNHKDSRDKICPICRADFLFPKDLKRHMKTHGSARPYLCSVATCKYYTKGFKRKDGLKKHEETHRKAVPTPSASSQTMSRHPSQYG